MASAAYHRHLKTEYLNDLNFINHYSEVEVVEKHIHFYNYQRLNLVMDYLIPTKKRLEIQNVA